MKLNRLYIIAIVLVSLLLLGGIAHAQTVDELDQKVKDAKTEIDAKKADYDVATAHLNKQVANFIRLHGHLAEIKLPSDSPATARRDLYMAIAKIAELVLNTNQLTSAMQEQLAAIEIQRGICNDIWADVVLAQTCSKPL